MWKKYIAFGDSVTAGIGDPVPSIEMKGWTDRVAEFLTAHHSLLSYVNLAHRGSTTVDALHNRLPDVLDAKPDLISFTVGANDARLPKWSIESFAEEFEQILELFATQGTTIITMAYPDLRPAILKSGNEIPKGWRLYFRRMKDTNAVIRKLSESYDACFLDFEAFEAAQDPVNISDDLVHPNAMGYKLAADVAYQTLTEKFALSVIS